MLSEIKDIMIGNHPLDLIAGWRSDSWREDVRLKPHLLQ